MFQGLTKKTTDFLNNLKNNNQKEWFMLHKEVYEKEVKTPCLDLAEELIPFMQSIDPDIDPNPKKCISRIYRDVRFSKDKSPYRPNVWLAFKKSGRDWKADPVYFFEIFHDSYRFGMGFYAVPKEALEKLREWIVKKNPKFEKINALYQEQNSFHLEGIKYKKNLNALLSAEQLDWYQRKELYFMQSRQADDMLYSPGLAGELFTRFKKLEPYYHFFQELKKKG